MDSKNENMVRNEKAEFAVKMLLEYANENGINGRDTTDLSPLEQWLILRLYNVVGQSEQYHCELYDFGRKDKPCDKQCDGCKAINLD